MHETWWLMEEDARVAQEVKSTVSGLTRTKESSREIANATYVITNEEMKLWGVRSLHEALGRTPGFAFYDTDHYGYDAVMTRGQFGISRIGLSVEGAQTNNWGHFVFVPSFYKSVEVSRGPSGLAWGSAAQAGLINLRIRDDLNGAIFSSQLGNFNRRVWEGMWGHQFDNGKPGDHVFFGAHVVNQDPELRDDALGTTGRKIYLNGIQGSYNLVASGAFMGFKAVLQLDNSRRVAPQMWFNGGTTAAELYEQVRAVSADQYPGDKSDNLIGRIAYTLPVKAVQATLYARMSRFMWSFHPIFSNAEEVVATGFTLSTKLWSERITINSGGEAGMSTGLGAYNTPVATEKFDIHWLGPDHSEKPRGFNGFANAYLQVRAEVYKGLKLLAGGRLDTFHFIKIGSATDSSAFFNGPQAGVYYEILPNKLSVKYNYNNSIKAPSGPLEGKSLLPERSQAHELGANLTLGETLTANVNTYYQVLSDIISTDFGGSGLVGTQAQGGTRTAIGAEVDVAVVPVNFLKLYSNLSFVDSHNQDKKRTLYQPIFNGIVGAVAGLRKVGKIAADVRVNLGMPYTRLSGGDAMANNAMLDFTLASEKILDAFGVKVPFDFDLSFSMLNVTDNRAGVPTFGEHIRLGQGNGLIAPEGRRFFGRINLYLF